MDQLSARVGCQILYRLKLWVKWVDEGKCDAKRHWSLFSTMMYVYGQRDQIKSIFYV